MLPGPGPGSVLCMIRERHVILKAALHSRLATSLFSLIPKLLHCIYIHNYDTMMIQVYY